MLLLLFAIVLALPFSATGTRLLMDGINRSQIVQLDYAGGSLFGDLALSGLAMELGTVTLQLDRSIPVCSCNVSGAVHFALMSLG